MISCAYYEKGIPLVLLNITPEISENRKDLEFYHASCFDTTIGEQLAQEMAKSLKDNYLLLQRKRQMPYLHFTGRAMRIAWDKRITGEFAYFPICDEKTRIKFRHASILVNHLRCCPKRKEEFLINIRPKSITIQYLKREDAESITNGSWLRYRLRLGYRRGS